MLGRWPATALCAAAILSVSRIPRTDLPSRMLFPHADKAVHVGEYLLLGGLLVRSLSHELSGNFLLAAIITIIAGTVFGALDEWHQSFTGRVPDAWDVAADLVGLIAGTTCVAAIRWWRKTRGQ